MEEHPHPRQGREEGRRSQEEDAEETASQASDLACFWEHPELVYITPRQGSRRAAWVTSLDKVLPGCAWQGPSGAGVPVQSPRTCYVRKVSGA